MKIMSQEFDFSKEFQTDADVEIALDVLITIVAQAAQKEDNRTQVVNPITMQHLLYTYKVLKYLTKGTGAKVTYEINEPYKSMGSVTVCGRNIVFKKPEWFIKAVELAANFEAYPKTDGTVEMNFTFHGLTMPAED